MLDTSLARVETWLAAHAPRILHASLNPGAKENDLASLEKAIGKPLPDDFRQLYCRFNGMDEEADNLGSFFYAMRFLPLTEVKRNVEHLVPEPRTPLHQAGPSVDTNHPLTSFWLPIGFDDSHTWLCVDLSPVETGRYGQIIFVDEEHETAFCIADSLASLLRDFADDLEQGLYTLDPDALDDEDEFLVPDATIDVMNWWQASRWQAAGLPPPRGRSAHD